MTIAATKLKTVTSTRTRVKEAGPFLKWVGGKRGLMPQLESLFPRRFERYFEPFVGGGAVFFHLAPEVAYLADDNAELMNAYRVVRDDVERLIAHLATHRNDEEYYYALRATDPDALDPIERASRLIYLNRTCFNGLYRVNSKGEFNVPYGKYKNPNITNELGLRAASDALQGARLATQPYMAVLEEARPGDFIYFDPPYHPLNATSNFTSYTAGQFTARDQEDLAKTFIELANRGCKVMLSNSDVPFIHDLYAAFHIEKVMAPRLVNRDATKRGPVSELVIRNYRR
jgi:DNA adenine methylase